jgi:hypothetical protein
MKPDDSWRTVDHGAGREYPVRPAEPALSPAEIKAYRRYIDATASTLTAIALLHQI